MARLECAARDLAEFAAQAGAPDALYELGLMYCTGRDVGFDLVSAHKWFNLAAMRGNEEAKRLRVEIALEMTKKEVAEAQKQAREWLRSH